MVSVVGAILAIEVAWLVILFPRLRRKMLANKEARERFLRSLYIKSPRAVSSVTEDVACYRRRDC